ncbi:MAG: NAD-dependent epimerase/dehydratase family protein, partial [Flavobacteriaceae bacterium]
MKILITGATGLIGKEIVNQCRSRDIPVHFLTTSHKKLNSIKGADGFFWDPAKQEIDLNCF